MLRSIKEMQGISIDAKDGEIGKIYDLYFEDALWVIRYFVADTGNWLPGRKVLLPPTVIGSPNGFHENIPVDLTIEQIKNSPDTDFAKPISRQYEAQLHDYFQWAPYWLHESPGAVIPQNIASPDNDEVIRKQVQKVNRIKENSPNLRSARNIIGYYAHAKNGEVGHVEDFYVDDETWQITYMLLDLRNWLPGGKKILVARYWIEKMDWVLSTVHLSLSREVIANSPEFDGKKFLRRSWSEHCNCLFLNINPIKQLSRENPCSFRKFGKF